MAWRDELRPGSFRGVPFLWVGDAEQKGGRRGPLHEYPGRDEPYFEDLGRKPRAFRLDVVLLDPEAMAQRAALVAALEEPGAGTLSHPLRGEIEVVCRDYTVRESSSEGGVARLSIELVVAGANRFPAARSDSRAQADATAAAGRAEIEARLSEVLRTDRLPEFLRAGVEALLGEVAPSLALVLADLEVSAATRSMLVQLADEFAADAPTLASGPASIGSRVSELLVELAAAGEPEPTYTALGRLARFGDAVDEPPATTPTRRTERANHRELVGAVRGLAALESARLVSRIRLRSYDHAVRLRESLQARVEPEIEAAAERGDDDGFKALSRALAGAVADITARASTRARLITFVPVRTAPALAIAYRLYGDATRDTEIVARNRIAFPGFVPGGEPLEILADG